MLTPETQQWILSELKRQFTIDALPAELSDRRFYRITCALPHKETLILMRYPLSNTQGLARFLACTKALQAQGCPVPTVIAHQPTLNLCLLSDHGQQLSDALTQENVCSYYQQAIDLLCLNQQQMPTSTILVKRSRQSSEL